MLSRTFWRSHGSPFTPRKHECSRHDHHFARCLSKVTELITSGGARTGFICEVSDSVRFLSQEMAHDLLFTRLRIITGASLACLDSVCWRMIVVGAGAWLTSAREHHTRHRGRVRAILSAATPPPHQDMVFGNLRSARCRCDVQHIGAKSPGDVDASSSLLDCGTACAWTAACNDPHTSLPSPTLTHQHTKSTQGSTCAGGV